ncbi:hypothetical protein OBBRIDRAFT_799687 [Obba rivulosa]|uniref:Uncharacterized protein n=1 Tax=Obba rivulosa TaxID=1052685 RepID=A0A8E2DE71_9APHY|nr:hypothetical protein OBBRIDRAFT_799687 [Obba rivulosa]
MARRLCAHRLVHQQLFPSMLRLALLRITFRLPATPTIQGHRMAQTRPPKQSKCTTRPSSSSRIAHSGTSST